MKIVKKIDFHGTIIPEGSEVSINLYQDNLIVTVKTADEDHQFFIETFRYQNQFDKGFVTKYDLFRQIKKKNNWNKFANLFTRKK